MLRRIRIMFLCACAGCAILSVMVVAQQNSKRLILKDGSYQPATKWEIKGDRVRFYSSERYGWEELPTMLVDWTATEKYNRELEADRDAGIPKLNKEADKEEPPDKPETPPVAPGLRLPDDGGIFLLDTYRNQPELVEMAQNGGELNKHMGRNILRAAINPLALSSKQTVELRGAHAEVQTHVAQPAIYIQLDAGEAPAETTQATHTGERPGEAAKAPQVHPADAAQPAEHYRIVRVQTRKDSRVVGDLSIGVTGKMSQKENWVPTTSTRFGEWTKITPQEPLAKGEYAVVELLDKGQINLYVWDFGVDPAAPANVNARSGRPPEAEGESTPPVLKKHFFLF